MTFDKAAELYKRERINEGKNYFAPVKAKSGWKGAMKKL
jgi:hypothetical protein